MHMQSIVEDTEEINVLVNSQIITWDIYLQDTTVNQSNTNDEFQNNR